MTEAEYKVINLIKNSNDPAAALDVAIKLALEFLGLPQDAPCTSPAQTSVTV